jgi:hypothetical protein
MRNALQLGLFENPRTKAQVNKFHQGRLAALNAKRPLADR